MTRAVARFLTKPSLSWVGLIAIAVITLPLFQARQYGAFLVASLLCAFVEALLAKFGGEA